MPHIPFEICGMPHFKCELILLTFFFFWRFGLQASAHSGCWCLGRLGCLLAAVARAYTS
jgi:hypothetical protein